MWEFDLLVIKQWLEKEKQPGRSKDDTQSINTSEVPPL